MNYRSFPIWEVRISTFGVCVSARHCFHYSFRLVLSLTLDGFLAGTCGSVLRWLPEVYQQAALWVAFSSLVLCSSSLAALVSPGSQLCILNVGSLPGTTWVPSLLPLPGKSLRTVSWGNHRVHLTSVQFLLAHYLSLCNVQCLQKMISYILFTFLAVSGRRINCVPIIPSWSEGEDCTFKKNSIVFKISSFLKKPTCHSRYCSTDIYYVPDLAYLILLSSRPLSKINSTFVFQWEKWCQA